MIVVGVGRWVNEEELWNNPRSTNDEKKCSEWYIRVVRASGDSGTKSALLYRDLTCDIRFAIFWKNLERPGSIGWERYRTICKQSLLSSPNGKIN